VCVSFQESCDKVFDMSKQGVLKPVCDMFQPLPSPVGPDMTFIGQLPVSILSILSLDSSSPRLAAPILFWGEFLLFVPSLHSP
jgi:hypothetical protein